MASDEEFLLVVGGLIKISIVLILNRYRINTSWWDRLFTLNSALVCSAGRRISCSCVSVEQAHFAPPPPSCIYILQRHVTWLRCTKQTNKQVASSGSSAHVTHRENTTEEWQRGRGAPCGCIFKSKMRQQQNVGFVKSLPGIVETLPFYINIKKTHLSHLLCPNSWNYLKLVWRGCFIPTCSKRWDMGRISC